MSNDDSQSVTITVHVDSAAVDEALREVAETLELLAKTPGLTTAEVETRRTALDAKLDAIIASSTLGPE